MRFGPFDQVLKIGSRTVGAGHPAYLIGEIGSNHNGSIKIAKRMIDLGIEAGLDAVKFQNLNFEEQYLVKNASKATEKIHTYIDVKDEFMREVYRYAKKRGITCLSTATYPHAVEFLDRLGMPAFKVASPITYGYSHLIQQMGETKKPLIMSVGYCSEPDIDRAVQAVMKAKSRKLVLLHCTSSYPTPPDEIYLSYIKKLRDRYGCVIGFSDHSFSTSLSATAVALGACVIEKHFTLSRKMKGPDHSFALEPKELKEMVRNIRETEAALQGTRGLTGQEKERRHMYIAKVVTARDIRKGAKISSRDIRYLRSPGGIHESDVEKLVIGRKARKGMSAMQLIQRGDLI